MAVRYITEPDGCVDPTDRGLAYGDGLFETMSIRHSRVQRLDLHLDRLRQGCDRLALPMPESNELNARIATAAADIDRGHLKLILTRGSGPRGYAPPAAVVPTAILLAAPEPTDPAPSITVVSLSQIVGENVKLAGIKHLNRLEQVLGRVELADLDADEGLMLSTSGAVIGGTSRNLFARFGSRLDTPSLDRAGIAGIMRRAVLELCAELGIETRQRAILPEELDQADEVFMTNALVGVQSVSRLNGRAIDSDTLASRLRASLKSTETGQASA